MQKLKIGLVMDDSLDRNDGVQQYVRTVGRWLSSSGHEVHYLVGQTSSLYASTHSLSRNVRVRFNGNRLTIPLPANKQKIKSLLERENYDVLHIQMPYSPLLAGRVISQASKNTAVVGTFHILPLGQLQKLGSKLLSSVQRTSLKRFDAITSVSPAAQAFARKIFTIDTAVIPNTIDLKQWETVLHNHPGRIVFLGRLVARKGCRNLLNAIHKLPANLQGKLEVIIAGKGPEQGKLSKHALKLGLDNIKFIGYVSESDKASLLASAEIAVFPSLGGESFGIVLIEAMASGAGVVLAGNNPGYQSVLGELPSVLFDPKDSFEFAKTLQKFVEDKTLRKKIHQEQALMVKKYDTTVVGKQILGMYKQALLHRNQEMR